MINSHSQPPSRAALAVRLSIFTIRDPKFTIYSEAGHDAWTQTYANPQVYEWLLQQKRTVKKPENSKK